MSRDDETLSEPVRFHIFSRGWSSQYLGLSSAEREVVGLALKGHTNEEIAIERGTKASTVSRQLHTVYQKLGVSGRGELARVVFEG